MLPSISSCQSESQPCLLLPCQMTGEATIQLFSLNQHWIVNTQKRRKTGKVQNSTFKFYARLNIKSKSDSSFLWSQWFSPDSEADSIR